MCSRPSRSAASTASKYVLIFTAGFSEVGPKGAAVGAAVGEMARKYSMRVFGPNTNTNAFEVLPEPPKKRGGRIGLVTQSGHQGRPLVQGTEFGVAFSRWVPTGNELDLEAADFIEYFAHDDETAVIARLLRGFQGPAEAEAGARGRQLGAQARRRAEGRIDRGRDPDGLFAHRAPRRVRRGDDGLFRQYGVVRVRDLDELLETAALFAKLPAGTGPNACLYSISGGSGALMAEVAESHGVPVPILGAKRPRTRLRIDDPGLPDRREPRRQRSAVPRHEPHRGSSPGFRPRSAPTTTSTSWWSV